MPSSSKQVQDFLQDVCKEIRFKSIHGHIAKELSDHIEDQVSTYIGQGYDQEAANIKAV
jgi:hypothetical protein